MIGAILSDTMDIFVEQLTAMGVKLTDEQIKLARAKTATEIGIRSSKETRLAEVSPELLDIVQDVLSYTCMDSQYPYRIVLGLKLLNRRMKTAIDKALGKQP